MTKASIRKRGRLFFFGIHETLRFFWERRSRGKKVFLRQKFFKNSESEMREKKIREEAHMSVIQDVIQKVIRAG